MHRIVRDRPRRPGWRPGYLGPHSWRWVRAAVHEVYGRTSWRSVATSLSRGWALVTLVALSAWVDKGEMSFGEALARAIHDALFRSPHVPQFGEKGGPYALVALVIATAGALTALFSPVALNGTMIYPLSRHRRARVHFGGGVVDAAIFLFIVGPALLVLGHVAGRFAGYEMRFDFMPFFLRVLLITVILMPLAHRGRLGLHAAARRRSEYTTVGVVFGVGSFVLAVCLCAFVSATLFASAPARELAALGALLAVSMLAYRHALSSYYRTADLA